MKKLIFSVMAVASLVFVGCSNDDDDANNCASCSPLGISIEACDNGDGTVTVTTLGESEAISGEGLAGQTAAEFVKELEQQCAALSNLPI